VIILGIVLMLAGFLLGVPILWTIGISACCSASSWPSWAAWGAPSADGRTTTDLTLLGPADHSERNGGAPADRRRCPSLRPGPLGRVTGTSLL